MEPSEAVRVPQNQRDVRRVLPDFTHHRSGFIQITLRVNLRHIRLRVAQRHLRSLKSELAVNLSGSSMPELVRRPTMCGSPFKL